MPLLEPVRRLFRRRDEGSVLLFDFDGVVADSLEAYFAAFTSVCTEMGFDRINSRESLLSLFDGNVFLQLVRAGFPVHRLREMAVRFAPRIRAIVETVPPFPGMPETLSRLAARHPLYIITSNETAVVKAFLERHGVTGVRDIIGADIEPSKVKKIRAARKREPRRTPYYIGDTRGDMTEARRARALPVAVTWGWHPEARLLSGKPWRAVHTPEELERLFP
jgi:phosphoglycolate phosphatase